MAAYTKALDRLYPSQEDAAVGFTMNALASRYWQSTAFKAKKPRTRYVERRQLERFLETHGGRDCRKAMTVHFDAIFASMADRPAAAMDLRKKLRTLFKLAIKLGWRTDNPIDATDTFRLGTHHTWTEDEIAAFHARWERGTPQRTAFDLLLFSGQRSGDVRSMTWADVRDGRVRVDAQGKTGAFVLVPQHPELVDTLAAHPRSQVVIVVNAFGRPFTEKGFGNWMADAIEAAGLPDRCVTHGLRKAASRRLADAGCTDMEIMSITGHRTRKEVQRYTDRADRARLAEAGMAKAGTSARKTYRKPRR